MTDNEIIKAFDILDKFEFFGGQRAGRELWFNKPADIQEKDIGGFLRDIDFLKQFINRQKAEIERLQKEFEITRAYIHNNGLEWGLVSHLEFYKNQRAEAIKEFAVRLKNTDLYEFIEEYYENAELCYEVRQDQFQEYIDNIVKEMEQETNERKI